MSNTTILSISIYISKMLKFFEIFAFVFSINFAHGCNDIDGTTVDSKSHPKANGCYVFDRYYTCLLYTSPSPRDGLLSRMPSSA